MRTTSAIHSGDPVSHDNSVAALAALDAENNTLRDENSALKRRVEWFERQLFGQKSEKRPVDNPHQPSLLGEPPIATAAEGEQITVSYQRGKAPKQRPDDCVNDSGLRFTAEVPVEVITLTAPELKGADADQFEIIGSKSTFRLAQRPASYVVLRYDRPVIKRKDAEQPLPSPAPDNVLDRSLADVSLLVGLLVDKFQYHLPLYRQHQRITQAGITLSRATLTNLVKRAIDLLRPIVGAQLENILLSRVLAMDETPIKAGKAGKGKLKQAWFWPLYGDGHEVVFTYSASRSRQHIEKTLKEDFKGTLISDGYAAYASYAKQNENITHAQCWVHYPESIFIWSKASDCRICGHCMAAFGGIKYRLTFRGTGVRCSSGSRRPSRARPMWRFKGGAWRDYQAAHCTRKAAVRFLDTAPIPV